MNLAQQRGDTEAYERFLTLPRHLALRLRLRLEEIAPLLDDRVAVVETSYIGWNWPKVAGRTQEMSVSRTPPEKLIRSVALQRRFASRSTSKFSPGSRKLPGFASQV